MDVGRVSKKNSFLCQFSIILSDFVMLNFVAIHKGISTTQGTSVSFRLFFLLIQRYRICGFAQ